LGVYIVPAISVVDAVPDIVVAAAAAAAAVVVLAYNVPVVGADVCLTVASYVFAASFVNVRFVDGDAVVVAHVIPVVVDAVVYFVVVVATDVPLDDFGVYVVPAIVGVAVVPYIALAAAAVDEVVIVVAAAVVAVVVVDVFVVFAIGCELFKTECNLLN